MISIRLFFLTLILSTTLFAPIFEYRTMHQLQEHINAANAATTLLVFDLDNTLIEPYGLIGSDQWFTHMMSNHPHIHYLDAAQKIVPLYHEIRKRVPVQLVEVVSADIIRAAQERGFRAIGLTLQSEGLANATIECLHKVGIRFTQSSLLPTAHHLKLPHRCLHKEGIVFCSGKNNKGAALIAALKESGSTPSTIIFVDDKEHHLQVVKKALHEQMPDIQFIGIRYSYLDEKINNFDSAAAAEEMKLFLEQHPHVHDMHVMACGQQ